jgi:ketosteroid isomerase-like protein
MSTTPTTSTPATAGAAATQLLDAMKDGDLETAFAALSADNVIHEPASLWYGGDWKGPEGFGQILTTMSQYFDIQINGYEIFEAGEIAVMKADITFTAKATGRSLTMPVVEIYRGTGGQLVDMDIYYKDTAALLALCDADD